jgi:steroid delta-isomerase-like uncharacterized protein
MASAEEQNRQVVSHFFEFYNAHNIESIEQLISSTNYSFHFPGMPPMDWNGHKQFIDGVISAFPDFRHNIIDVVTEGDKVAVRFNITGTHKGEFQGMPPTGKQVSFEGTEFFTIIDGKIVEEWVIVDMIGLLQQIGAIPTSPSAASSTARS